MFYQPTRRHSHPRGVSAEGLERASLGGAGILIPG